MISIDDVLDYEAGVMSEAREVEFFADLIRTGAAWTLQGFYGRAAARFIEAGVIDRDGNVLVECYHDEGYGDVQEHSSPNCKWGSDDLGVDFLLNHAVSNGEWDEYAKIAATQGIEFDES